MKAIDRELLEKLLQSPLYGPVFSNMVQQQVKGIEKYDSLLDIDKWDAVEYIEHLQQELIDGNVYIEGVKQHLLRLREGEPIHEELDALRVRNRELIAEAAAWERAAMKAQIKNSQLSAEKRQLIKQLDEALGLRG